MKTITVYAVDGDTIYYRIVIPRNGGKSVITGNAKINENIDITIDDELEEVGGV